jgi:putative toxin-antitoxin system antitoxin component (TIGR02293 family)
MNKALLTPILGDELRRLRRELGLSRDRLASSLGLAPRTLARIEAGQGEAHSSTLDRLAALRHVLLVAEEVLGDRETACIWLVRPHPHYGESPPVEMLSSYAGTVEVLRALDRLAEGVMS